MQLMNVTCLVNRVSLVGTLPYLLRPCYNDRAKRECPRPVLYIFYWVALGCPLFFFIIAARQIYLLPRFEPFTHYRSLRCRALVIAECIAPSNDTLQTPFSRKPPCRRVTCEVTSLERSPQTSLLDSRALLMMKALVSPATEC